jgi:hypothetical protein
MGSAEVLGTVYNCWRTAKDLMRLSALEICAPYAPSQGVAQVLQMCCGLTRGRSPASDFCLILCAEPSFARLTHVYAGVIELPRTKVDSLALAIDVSLDNAL